MGVPFPSTTGSGGQTSSEAMMLMVRKVEIPCPPALPVLDLGDGTRRLAHLWNNPQRKAADDKHRLETWQTVNWADRLQMVSSPDASDEAEVVAATVRACLLVRPPGCDVPRLHAPALDWLTRAVYQDAFPTLEQVIDIARQFGVPAHDCEPLPPTVEAFEERYRRSARQHKVDAVVDLRPYLNNVYRWLAKEGPVVVTMGSWRGRKVARALVGYDREKDSFLVVGSGGCEVITVALAQERFHSAVGFIVDLNTPRWNADPRSSRTAP